MSSRLYHDIAPVFPEMQAADIIFGRDGVPLARLDEQGVAGTRG